MADKKEIKHTSMKHTSMKHTSMKQKILDSLEGNLVVTKIKEDFKEDIAVICDFIKDGKKGVFRYYWNKDNIGIDYVRDYDEDEDEDIYHDVHCWVDTHFKHKISVSLKYNGKELIK